MKDGDAIAALREKHIEGFNRQDPEAMASTSAEDVVIMAPNQPAVVGLDAARAWWRSGFALADARLGYESQELMIEGALAVDRFHWTMKTTPKTGGDTIRDDGDCIWIWRRSGNGSWRLSHAIWNSNGQSPSIWSGAPRA